MTQEKQDKEKQIEKIRWCKTPWGIVYEDDIEKARKQEREKMQKYPMNKEQKEDTKKFQEMWKRQSLLTRILWFPFKSLLREGFEIGFTNGVEWTFKELKKQEVKQVENSKHAIPPQA